MLFRKCFFFWCVSYCSSNYAAEINEQKLLWMIPTFDGKAYLMLDLKAILKNEIHITTNLYFAEIIMSFISQISINLIL